MFKKLLARCIFRIKSILMSFGVVRSKITGFNILQKETYLKMIENSVGTKMFCSIFVRKNDTGKTEDILRGGDYSCAFFVSSVLSLCGLMNERSRTTVKGLRENLRNSSNWKEAEGFNLKLGDVVFWERMTFEDGSQNEHVGLVLNQFQAVSTSDKEKMVVRHHITFGLKPDEKSGLALPIRKITQVFRYKF